MSLYLLQIIACISLSVLLASEANAGCSVSATSINFGNYDVFSSASDTGTGSVTLSCAPKSNVSIAIEASTTSGSFNPRMMQHFTLDDTLNYTIYTTAAMTSVWGDGTQGTATVDVTNVKNGNTPSVIIYGKIAPLQNVSAGSYSEQLVITISF